MARARALVAVVLVLVLGTTMIVLGAGRQAVHAAAGEQTFDVAHSGTCSGWVPSLDRYVEFPASYRVTGSAPARAVLDDPVTVTFTATATMETDESITKIDAQVGSQWYQVNGESHSITVTAPQDQLRLWLANVNVWIAGEPVTCMFLSDGPFVTIPVQPPADGSLQSFDMSALGRCSTNEGERYNATFRFSGLAPSVASPGQELVLNHARYQGLNTAFPHQVTLSVSGDGGSRAMAFVGGAPPRLDRVGASGVLEFRFAHVHAADQGLDPVRAIQIDCDFDVDGTVNPLRIPISGNATTTSTSTSTSTTTTRTRPNPVCALRSRLPAWLFNLLSRVLGIRC